MSNAAITIRPTMMLNKLTLLPRASVLPFIIALPFIVSRALDARLSHVP